MTAAMTLRVAMTNRTIMAIVRFPRLSIAPPGSASEPLMELDRSYDEQNDSANHKRRGDENVGGHVIPPAAWHAGA